ncbi:hypothetical protein E2562_014742 [Oryza meyeriana var. granulata]|uniref:ACT domain-containing protein ACR n=1 Tax=Oryza meyeriana var. granulata TaxID=110450 RepID=A0A6G1BLD1_9ORYZ|nr:hypothetical protein E2562_014742 [Oryza meyeriana var. granulata]
MALELTGADRTGLILEVFAVLADMDCSIVEAWAWTHHGRLSCLVFLRDEEADTERMARIEARLGHLLRGGDSTSADGLGGAVAAVVTHAECLLHQLMSADCDQEERAASTKGRLRPGLGGAWLPRRAGAGDAGDEGGVRGVLPIDNRG